MSDNFTRGPWLVTMIGSGKLGTAYVIREHTHASVNVWHDGAYWDRDYEPETDTDGYYLPDENMDCSQHRVDTARLIAAAPSLLAELVKIKQTIENSDEWWMDEPDRGGFDMKAIDDAIALARGGK